MFIAGLHNYYITTCSLIKPAHGRKLLRPLIILFFFCMHGFTAYAQKITPMYGSLPELGPAKTRLFYLQRTIDRNTLIYETNYNADGTINEKIPVKIYWIDFDDGGKISPLTFMQKNFAYGVESKLIDLQKKIFLLHIAAYKKIDLYMERDKNDDYKIYMAINKKNAVLSRIIVNITGGTYLKPNVSFIEFTGNDLTSGKQVSEKIYP